MVKKQINKMEKLLKKYDKFLEVKRGLDGSIDIVRQSPFYSRTQYKALSLKNEFVGSGKWILKKIISMDTTRHDLVGDVLRNNEALRHKKDSRNIHEDMAEFMLNGSSMFIR